MATSETPARDAVLVKYLNEAFGKEKQLETALQAQIALAKRPQLKKGLQDHLKVTKAQARGLQKRIKELGGKAEVATVPGPAVATEAASKVTEVANRALAAAKGPVQALRGTSEADNELRNVRDCYWNEAEEIAHYQVIEAVATELGDKETARLAKTYRREEEKMQTLLERQIPQLVKAVVKEEVPAAERRRGGTARRSTATSRTAASRRSSNGAGAGSGSRSLSTRANAAQKAAATRTARSARTSAKRTATSARGTAKSAGTTARKAGSAARSTAKRAAK
jgi:ferritin-like metal-binding protein YciE